MSKTYRRVLATLLLGAVIVFTQTELRRAINVQAKNEGLARVEDAQPCAPFLRGHRFFVKHQGRVVHEVSLYVPGGC